MKTPEPGIYPDVPHEDYLKWDALSASAIERWFESAAHGVHYQQTRHDPDPPSWQMRLGTALHMRVLEPDKYEAQAIEVPKLKGQAVPATWLKAEAEHPGKLVLAEGWLDTIETMTAAIRQHPDARKLLAMTPRERECSIVWDDPSLGVRCKARVDWWVRGKAVPDIKTARSVDPVEFAKNAADLGYHRKHAWYVRAVLCATGEFTPGYSMIAVLNEPPHVANVFVWSWEAVRQGWAECCLAAQRYRLWATSGEVAPFSNGWVEIDLPKWKKAEGFQALCELDELGR